MAFTEANTVALTEKASSLSFPATDAVKSAIPLWMKFYCFEYSNTALTRAMTNTTTGSFLGQNFKYGLLKTLISVPAPVNFETTTSHVYQVQQTAATTTLPPAVGGALSAVTDYIPFFDSLPSISSIAQDFTTSVNQFAGEWTGIASDIPKDDNDAVYTPSGPSRLHEVKLFFPCLTPEDSIAAGEIIRAFEAFSLPTIQSFLTLESTKFFHPPLWVFGITDINGNVDADWSGQPLLSALVTVKTRKVAYDVNSLSAVGSNFKPVGHSVALVFKEIEPAVRLLGPAGTRPTNAIANRSGAIVRGGINVL